MSVVAALVPPVVAATAFITIAIMVYRYTVRSEAAEDQAERPEKTTPRNGDVPS